MIKGRGQDRGLVLWSNRGINGLLKSFPRIFFSKLSLDNLLYNNIASYHLEVSRLCPIKLFPKFEAYILLNIMIGGGT